MQTREQQQNMSETLAAAYVKLTGQAVEPATSLNGLLLDAFTSHADLERLNAFLRDYSWIGENIIRRRSESFLFRQPGILLAYYAAKNLTRDKFMEAWVLPESEARIIFSDLGISNARD